MGKIHPWAGHWIGRLASRVLGGIAAACCFAVSAAAAEAPAPRFVNLSLLVAPEYPCTWPTFPHFQINHEEQIGPRSAYNSDILIIDGNTGTQLDVPPHSVTAPDSGLPNAGRFGRAFTDVISAWQFGGEACLIDCRDLLESAPPGHSGLIDKNRVMVWEKEHRVLGPGDVVLFRSGYSDRFYRPLPEGRRFAADPVEGKTPAWPDPDPECMEYLAGRKVMTLGTDSASMGPLPDLAEPTHYAGLKHGRIWSESATGLGELPPTGAFYCMLSPKYADGLYAEGRAFGVVGASLAGRLIESARKRNAVDLSVVLSEDLPISQSCGPARIIDVKHLPATTDCSTWPASPEITVEDIRKHESRHGELRPGDIVILHTGWSDQYCRPFPAGKACLDDPLNGKSEGWPALGPDAVLYLAEKGIRCVATDAPTLGGVEPKRALWTYWALGTRGLIGVEYLTNVGRVPEGAYFLFAAVKIRGCHGGPGRAIALY